MLKKTLDFFSLICDCKKKVEAGKYKVFALGYYGECWAGKDETLFDNMLKDSSNGATDCIDHIYGKCHTKDHNDNNNTCVGGSGAEYAYKLPVEAPKRKFA